MTTPPADLPPYQPVSPDQLASMLSGSSFIDHATARAMANEILILRRQISVLAQTFKPISKADDDRLQWFLRAFRGIAIENRILAIAVYFVDNEDGTQSLRWGGAQAVGDKLMELIKEET